MMTVTLADTLITVSGWEHRFDHVGTYRQKVRKTPQEMREERQLKEQTLGPGKYKVSPVYQVQQSVLMFDKDHPDEVYFLPGLWPRVKALLENEGVDYTIVDKRNPAIRPPLDPKAFDGVELRNKQDVAIAMIAASDCGIIETATAFGKSFCIALLCKALPTLNIVITTSSVQVVNTLYEYLCKTIPGQVGIICAGKNRVADKRVIVSTLKSLGNIKAEKVHLLLVDECHALGNNQAAKAVMQFCFARRFGFSASPIRNDGTGLMLESLLGPTILKMDYQEAVESGMVTPMKYTMLQCSRGPSEELLSRLPEFMLKRLSYWCNDYRNKVIANFVYDIKKVFDGQILLVVSTLEHAIRLHMLLPWFKVAYYGNTDFDYMQRKFPREKYPNLDLSKYKLTQKQLDITRNAFAKGTLKWVISTKIFKQGVNFVHLKVLIRADGDTSEIEGIQIPGRLARLDKDKKCAYLIDIDDRFSNWAESRSKSRSKQYDKQQWQHITSQEMLDDLSREPKKDSD